MASRCLGLLLGLTLLGCDSDDPIPVMDLLASTPSGGLARAQAKTGLVLRASHVVLESELVCGVLTVTNTSSTSIALIDRWNSWGAHQWTLQIGDQEGSNPQMDWYANFYTETPLRPGETRHHWFTLARSYSTEDIRVDPWKFVVGSRSFLWVEQSLREFDSFKPFRAGQPLIVTLEGSAPESPLGRGVLPVLQWTGTASVTSAEVESVEDLESLVAGETLR